MRILTSVEIEYVSGGQSDGPDIVVVGRRNDEIVVTGRPPQSGPSSEGSGPGVHSMAYGQQDCAAYDLVELMKDAASYGAPDSNTFEYVGYIFEYNGMTHISDIGTSNENNRAAVTPAQLGVPAGALLVGIVHSHPTVVIQDPKTGVTEPIRPESREYASMPSFPDMQTLQNRGAAYVQSAVPGATPIDFVSYVSFDGKIKEFRYSEQDWSKMSSGNNGNATWAKTSNYAPCAGIQQ